MSVRDAAAALALIVFSLPVIISALATESSTENKKNKMYESIADRNDNSKQTIGTRNMILPIMKSITPLPPSYPELSDDDSSDIFYETSERPLIFNDFLRRAIPISIGNNCFNYGGHHTKRFAAAHQFEEYDNAMYQQYDNLRARPDNDKESSDLNNEYYLDVYIDKSNINDEYINNLQNIKGLEKNFLDCMDFYRKLIKSEKNYIVLQEMPGPIAEIAIECEEIKRLLKIDRDIKMSVIAKQRNSKPVKKCISNPKRIELDNTSTPAILQRNEPSSNDTDDEHVTENRQLLQDQDELKMAVINTRELTNGSIVTSIEGIAKAQDIDNNTKYNTETISRKEIFPVLSGRIMLKVEDYKYIPMYFTQNENGHLNINIDNISLCDSLLKTSNNSKILKAICKY